MHPFSSPIFEANVSKSEMKKVASRVMSKFYEEMTCF